MWGEKSELKKPKNKAYFVNLKQTKKNLHSLTTR